MSSNITRRMAASICLLFSLLLFNLLGAGWAQAGAFEVQDRALEMQQSRNFASASAEEVLRACIAVLQDIKFQVTESKASPGLIVAESPAFGDWPGGHTLTVSLQAVPGRENSHVVRVSAAAGKRGPLSSGREQPDYVDLYQNFFSHLTRELFRERTAP